MKLSDYVSVFLAEHECSHVFADSGCLSTQLAHALSRRQKVHFIPLCQGQGGAFAVNGYARRKNRIGTVLVAGGVNAFSLIPAIENAYSDSVPCLYLIAHENTENDIGDGSERWKNYLAEDFIRIVKPFIKYAAQITQPLRIRYELEKAVLLANTGRKGPVLLDIPVEIQCAEMDVDSLDGYSPCQYEPNDFDIDLVAHMLLHATRPVILAGGGVRLSGAHELLRVFAGRMRIPVVCSLMGRDAYDNTQPNYFGMIGCCGNRYANLTAANSDLILAIGTRLDVCQTGTGKASFARQAKLVRVDIDPSVLLNKIKPDEYGIQMDAGVFLRRLLENPVIRQIQSSATRPWLERITEFLMRYPSFTRTSFEDPNYVLKELSSLLKADDIVCLDAGQSEMWAAQSMVITGRQRFLPCGTARTMGFALPAAIGAYFAKSRSGRVFALTDIQGLEASLPVLEFVKREHIPIKIIVLNNQSRDGFTPFQQMRPDSRHTGGGSDGFCPDFCKAAQAYSIQSVRVDSVEQLYGLKTVLEQNEPVLVNLSLPHSTHVFPSLSVNRPIEDQNPLLPREELAGNLLVKLHLSKKYLET